jgi:hypothetical protein
MGKIDRKIIKHFHECWVPDNLGDINLSGKLGHTPTQDIPVKYIGPLSRFSKQDISFTYKVMVLLSGPEPQRSYLEDKLLGDLKHYKGNVLFIKGKIEAQQKKETRDHMEVYNFMTSTELEIAINESDLILSRSGYTTIMDLAKLDKKAFFIPTPGQFEQEYLAKKFTKDRVAPSVAQDEFDIKMLSNVDDYTLNKLIEAKEEDLYLSNISPLGVPFNSLKGNSKDVEKLSFIKKGRPGSACHKKYLVSTKEFTEKSICTASRQYQKLKLKELDNKGLSTDEYKNSNWG